MNHAIAAWAYWTTFDQSEAVDKCINPQIVEVWDTLFTTPKNIAYIFVTLNPQSAIKNPFSVSTNLTF